MSVAPPPYPARRRTLSRVIGDAVFAFIPLDKNGHRKRTHVDTIDSDPTISSLHNLRGDVAREGSGLVAPVVDDRLDGGDGAEHREERQQHAEEERDAHDAVAGRRRRPPRAAREEVEEGRPAEDDRRSRHGADQTLKVAKKGHGVREDEAEAELPRDHGGPAERDARAARGLRALREGVLVEDTVQRLQADDVRHDGVHGEQDGDERFCSAVV